jgi:predicted DNA-binding transcriptional regulator YafY
MKMSSKIGCFMRADRLLSMLLLLQSSARMTADVLAQELEVSKRTVYRDIDALNIAGIPIYTQPGTQGGVFLDENYRMSLSGLSKIEVQSLFAAIDSQPMRELGLSSEDTLRKLNAMLPDNHQQALKQMQQRFYIDTANWMQAPEESPYLANLQKAVWENRCVEVVYEHSAGNIITICLEAYALVAKANIWYLVGKRVDGKHRNYRISRLQSLRLLPEYFQRNETFDLKAYWLESCRIFEDEMAHGNPPYPTILRIHPGALWYFPNFMNGLYERVSEPDEKGWVTVRVRFHSFGDAQMRVLGLATQVEVVEPDELAACVLQTAKAIVLAFSKN